VFWFLGHKYTQSAHTESLWRPELLLARDDFAAGERERSTTEDGTVGTSGMPTSPILVRRVCAH